MTTGISIAIPLGFMLLAATLGWYLAYVKGRWPLKLLLTGTLILFSLQVYDALDSYAGWPTTEEMPERAMLYQAIVREPNPSKHDPGAIFLMLVPIGRDDPDPFSYRPVSGKPRLYEIPYSRAAREQADQASKMIQQGRGRPVLIQRNGRPGGAGNGQDGNQTTYEEDDDGFHIGEQPGPSLPDKGAPDPHGH